MLESADIYSYNYSYNPEHGMDKSLGLMRLLRVCWVL
jgi:hypothetical protein